MKNCICEYILSDKLRVASPKCMEHLELLPLPVCKIAFVNILNDKLRVASPKCMKNSELLPLPACRIAFVNILSDKSKSCYPYVYEELHL